MKAVKKLIRELKKPAYTQMMRKPKRRGVDDGRSKNMCGFWRNAPPR